MNLKRKKHSSMYDKLHMHEQKYPYIYDIPLARSKKYKNVNYCTKITDQYPKDMISIS